MSIRRLFLILAACACAYSQSVESWSAALAGDYVVTPNITYLTANNYAAKLDVYRPRGASAPVPVLVYIHGGGWVAGAKEAAMLNIMPYLEMGWAVVNVEYRMGPVSLAPAAVEDCLCALKWVIRNAKANQFDVDKIVVTGHSAGGHLSLTTGMMSDTDLHRECPGNEKLKVAAIVNWYGITDVVDLLDGPNQKSYAVQWLGSMPDRNAIAKRVSPLEYVRKDMPPVITIHGDADPTVPYQHGVRLHQALEKAGVPNQLVTVPGGKHGGFSRDENIRVFKAIREFLAKQGLSRR
jgi:acetyl esterase/lipase